MEDVKRWLEVKRGFGLTETKLFGVWTRRLKWGQGDQIRWIFDAWLTVLLWSALWKFPKKQTFLGYFFRGTSCASVWTKNGFGLQFWAIIFSSSSGHPAASEAAISQDAWIFCQRRLLTLILPEPRPFYPWADMTQDKTFRLVCICETWQPPKARGRQCQE
jgi:hypothetical protein